MKRNIFNIEIHLRWNKPSKLNARILSEFHSKLVGVRVNACEASERVKLVKGIKINPLTNFMVSSEMIAHKHTDKSKGRCVYEYMFVCVIDLLTRNKITSINSFMLLF